MESLPQTDILDWQGGMGKEERRVERKRVRRKVRLERGYGKEKEEMNFFFCKQRFMPFLQVMERNKQTMPQPIFELASPFSFSAFFTNNPAASSVD